MSNIGDRIFTSALMLGSKQNRPGSPVTDDTFAQAFIGACFASQYDGALIVAQSYPVDMRINEGAQNMGVDDALSSDDGEQEIAGAWVDDYGEWDAYVVRVLFSPFGSHQSLSLRIIASVGILIDTGAAVNVAQGGVAAIGQPAPVPGDPRRHYQFGACEVDLVNTVGLSSKNISVLATVTSLDSHTAFVHPVAVNVYGVRRF